MFASNFRWATGDVDIAPIKPEPPAWFTYAVRQIAVDMGFKEGEDWLNDAVGFHLSTVATEQDHWEFGTFPRSSDKTGLTVFVPTAEYMLALKLKAVRVLDPTKGPQEIADIQNLVQINNVRSVDHAVDVLAKFFPVSARSPEKLRFLLNHTIDFDWTDDHASEYPTRSI